MSTDGPGRICGCVTPLIDKESSLKQLPQPNGVPPPIAPLKISLNDAMVRVGSFGRYQKMLAVFLWGMVSPFLGFVMYGNMLLLLVPDHWCHVPEIEQLGLTMEEKKRLTIPLIREGEVHYSRCRRYDINFTLLDSQSDLFKMPNESWPTTSCTSGWEYDHSLVYPTLASEWNWVCENGWRTYLAYTVFWVGSSVGVVILGFLADLYGRVPVILAGHALCAVTSIATNFVTNFSLFLAVRFLIGFAAISQSMTAYVLVMEYVGTKQRLLISSGYLYAYPVVGCILPWVAYFLRDWRVFNISISVPLLLVPALGKYIPESLRWMISRGRCENAKEALKRIANVNKVTIEDEFYEKVKLTFSDNAASDKKSTVFDLLRTPNLRRIFLLTNVTWVMLSLCFTGGYIYAAAVSDNPFLMIAVNSAIDILSNVIADRLAEKYGRRPTTVVSCLVAALGYYASAVVPPEVEIAKISSLMVARLAVTVGYNINYLYAAEVYPTVVRSQALSVRQAFGSFGNFVSPQVVSLALHSKYLPLLVFGTMAAFAALAMLCLPETVNRSLPETLEDGEMLTKDTPFEYSCWKKKRRKTRETHEKVELSFVTRRL